MTVETYVKKPIIIEAIQLTKENFKESVDFVECTKIVVDGHMIVIRTLEGDMEANLGDYIIKGVEGEYYPCKESVFIKTYELKAAVDDVNC